MQHVLGSRPLEYVGIDFIGPLTKSANYQHVIIAIDYFTKYVVTKHNTRV